MMNQDEFREAVINMRHSPASLERRGECWSEEDRIGYNAMYELLSTGKLKAYRNGRVWRIPKVAVQDFILRQINPQS